MKVELKPIDSIKPYFRNTKKHNDKTIYELKEDIQRFGFDQPIVVDGRMVIIKGHKRYAALKSMKAKEVAVVVRADLSPELVQASRLADNKRNESEWDIDALEAELEALVEKDFDLASIGFDLDALHKMADFDAGKPEDQGQLDEKKKIKCPMCSHEFTR